MVYETITIRRYDNRACCKLKLTQTSKQSDDAIYQQEIEGLRQQLRESQSNAPKTTSQLSSLLAQREAEIAFLKDTVRIECEERMGLVSIVQNMKREGNVARSASTPPLNTVSSSSSSKDQNPVRASPKGGLAAKEQALHALFQAAVQKKERKLAKQRRG